MNMTFKELLLEAADAALGMAVTAILGGITLWFLWNAVLPELFNFPTINIIDSIIIYMMARLLTASIVDIKHP